MSSEVELYTVSTVGSEVTFHIEEQPLPAKTSTTPPDVVEVVDYVCSQCSKHYKGLRCLQKHIAICGLPKPKKKTLKRKSDEEGSSSSSPPKHGRDDQVPTGPVKNEEPSRDSIEEPQYVAVDVIKEEEFADEEMCYCCEEPLRRAHNGHVKCKLCKKNFHTYMGRDKHMINLHNSSEEFRCRKCQAQCVSAEVLEKHQANHLEFVCSTCGVEFHRRYHLDRHQENSKCTSTATKNEYSCDVCGKSFLRVDNLRVHLRGHLNQETRPKVHQCSLCEKTFFGASMLLIHVRTHTGERPFPCDLCTKAFPSNGALRKHRRVHTGEKPYECLYCPMKFAAKETLNRHAKTHTGKKAYKCEECGVSFIQRTQLKHHRFHHTGEHGHQCPHCDEKFDNKPSMTRHIASEHDLGIKCGICGSIFSTDADLKSHRESMHGENKRFICEDCCLEFEKKSQLLEHVAECGARAGKKPEVILSCRECGKVYKRHDLLVKHELTAHLEKEATTSTATNPSPKKRGRPRKIRADDLNKDEIFNQLKQNMVATFPESCEGTLAMDDADYRTERALRRVLEEILVGMLDEAVLEKVGWPKSGVLGTLEQVLRTIGVEVEEEEDEGTMSKLRTMMMALLGKFIGQEYLETMTNNYSTDQILHYMAASVRGNRAV